MVLGGTSQIGNWSTDVTASDRKRILDGCSRLIPSLQVNGMTELLFCTLIVFMILDRQYIRLSPINRISLK